MQGVEDGGVDLGTARPGRGREGGCLVGDREGEGTSILRTVGTGRARWRHHMSFNRARERCPRTDASWTPTRPKVSLPLAVPQPTPPSPETCHPRLAPTSLVATPVARLGIRDLATTRCPALCAGAWVVPPRARKRRRLKMRFHENRCWNGGILDRGL